MWTSCFSSLSLPSYWQKLGYFQASSFTAQTSLELKNKGEIYTDFYLSAHDNSPGRQLFHLPFTRQENICGSYSPPLIPRAWDQQSISHRQQVNCLQIHFIVLLAKAHTYLLFIYGACCHNGAPTARLHLLGPSLRSITSGTHIPSQVFHVLSSQASKPKRGGCQS